jgi:hypothetical protein
VRAAGEADDAPLDESDALQVAARMRLLWSDWRKLSMEQQRTWGDKQLGEWGAAPAAVLQVNQQMTCSPVVIHPAAAEAWVCCSEASCIKVACVEVARHISTQVLAFAIHQLARKRHAVMSCHAPACSTFLPDLLRSTADLLLRTYPCTLLTPPCSL